MERLCTKPDQKYFSIACRSDDSNIEYELTQSEEEIQATESTEWGSMIRYTNDKGEEIHEE